MSVDKMLIETEYHLITRSGVESADGKAENDDIVELEKSNVLMMGPTGSGTVKL